MTSGTPVIAAKARVFFVNRYFFPDESATSQLLSDLAFYLALNGYEVHIVCSRQLYDSAEARLPALETIRGAIVHRVWTTRFGRRRLLGRALDYATFYVTCAAALFRLLRRFDIVVAKTDPPLVSLVVWGAAAVKRAALVNWLQDVFPEVASVLGANPLPAALNRPLRRLRDASLRAAARNVVLGNRMRDYLRGRQMGGRGRQSRGAVFNVIENWADADGVPPKCGSDSELRSRLELTEKFVVGYSGNLGRAHDCQTVLGAAEVLRGEAGIAFLFIGGGAKMDALKTQVEQRRLQNFHFLPYQPRSTLPDSLAAADVHLVSLIPALEGLIVPSKFYGILAAGRPVLFVGDAQGELAGIIRESGCGTAVASGDSAALAGAIVALDRDAHARRAMGTAARELLCSRFSAQRAMASWMELLNGIHTVHIRPPDSAAGGGFPPP
jgi:glycosyltransferase involved in cell wall biosynthesis